MVEVVHIMNRTRIRCVNPGERDRNCAVYCVALSPFDFRPLQEDTIMWTKPSYVDLRIGFEVTMYFAHR